MCAHMAFDQSEPSTDISTTVLVRHKQAQIRLSSQRSKTLRMNLYEILKIFYFGEFSTASLTHL